LALTIHERGGVGEERIKRPKLGRTRPVRSWSTLFTAPGTAAPGVEPAAGRRPAASMGDVVSRSVELGYRVIDEYVRQGQKAAQRLGDRSFGAATMSSEASELAARMAQYASDFTALWLEFLQVSGVGLTARPSIDPSAFERGSSPAAPPSPVVPPPSPPSAGRVPVPGEMVRLKVAVVSPYPTEVSLDLRQKATNGRVTVQSLRAADGDKPRLSDVAIEDAEGAMTLRIRVPESQPAGIYTGLIVDEATSRPVGTVSLHITRE
jgi:hypothetical protein